MDKVALLPAAQRRELFSEAAARLGMTPAVVEKDFWVTWVLDRLFASPALARLLMFKGGTSLSKAYGLIERFSEDIDLILDWRVLGGDDPLAERSRTQQNRLNEEIDQQAKAYIAGALLEQVSAVLAEVCQCGIGADDAHVIEVRYPAAFPDTYLRPEVRLEIGPLAAWLPHEDRTISCYAAHAFPQVFERREFPVRVIRAERNVGVLVADVFDEEHHQHVVLVLAGIHAAAQLVAGRPERRVKLGFLDGHGVLLFCGRDVLRRGRKDTSHDPVRGPHREGRCAT
jgi:hypothetical protein